MLRGACWRWLFGALLLCGPLLGGLGPGGTGSLPTSLAEPAAVEAAPVEPAAPLLGQVRPDPRAGVTDHGERRQQHRERLRQRFLREHSDSTGQVRTDLWRQGVRAAQAMPVAAGRPRAAGPGGAAAAATGVSGLLWQQIGPQPIIVDNDPANPQASNNILFQGSGPDSGEVVDIAIDPRGTTDQTVYIVTNDGGVWKTTNGGTSWTALTDTLPSLSMGAVALDPVNPNIVYAGTGNNFDGGSVFNKGVGLYQSVDGGQTWSVLGGSIFQGTSSSPQGIGINRIALPASGVLVVATSGGVYYSIDAGQSFGSNAPAFNNGQPVLTGFAYNVAVDTASAPSAGSCTLPATVTVYATIKERGIFQSTDCGATFPTNLFANSGAPTGSYGLVTFSQSTLPSNQTLYASVSSPGGDSYVGLFKSTNGGGSWTRMTGADAAANADIPPGQFDYDLTVGVDPQDPQRVYIGFQELWLSTNGGTSFATAAITASQVHWDHHALVFSPRTHWGSGGAPTGIWIGTDGGVATSANGGTTWTNVNATIATNLFLGIDIGRGSSTNNGYTYGGTQDTGVIQHRPTDTANQWHLGLDGDGGAVVVNPFNAQQAWGSDDESYVVTTTAGQVWSFPAPASTGLPNCGGESCAQPLAADRSTSGVLYASGETSATMLDLYQSTNAGTSFVKMHTFTSAFTNVDILALAIAPSDSNTVWVSLDDGTLYKTANALSGAAATWTPVTVTGAPTGSSFPAISAIAIDPSAPTTVVVVYYGFNNLPQTGPTKHVFQTTNGGTSWTDISGTPGGPTAQNLPDLPLHAVVIDPGTTPHSIIVASDAGVMRTLNPSTSGASWQVLGVGLPTVYGSSLALDASATPELLRVGTYGRSVFELTTPAGPKLAVNANLAFGLVAAGSSTTLTARLFNVGAADLHVSSIGRTGAADFQIVGGPSGPFTIASGSEVDLTVQFRPTVGGIETATFQINSDDPSSPGTLPASGQAPAAATPTVTSTPTATTTPTATLTATIHPLTQTAIALTGTPTPTIHPLTQTAIAQTATVQALTATATPTIHPLTQTAIVLTATVQALTATATPTIHPGTQTAIVQTATIQALTATATPTIHPLTQTAVVLTATAQALTRTPTPTLTLPAVVPVGPRRVPCTTVVGRTCSVSGGVTGTWTKTGSGLFHVTATAPASALAGIPAIQIPTTTNAGGETFFNACSAVTGPGSATTCSGRTVGDVLHRETIVITYPNPFLSGVTSTGTVTGENVPNELTPAEAPGAAIVVAASLPLLPPPPPQLLPPPPSPLLPLLPPGPRAPGDPLAASPAAGVPLIPEAESLFLLIGGLAAFGALVARRARKRPGGT